MLLDNLNNFLSNNAPILLALSIVLILILQIVQVSKKEGMSDLRSYNTGGGTGAYLQESDDANFAASQSLRQRWQPSLFPEELSKVDGLPGSLRTVYNSGQATPSRDQYDNRVGINEDELMADLHGANESKVDV
jgi:hypothetical protein